MTEKVLVDLWKSVVIAKEAATIEVSGHRALISVSTKSFFINREQVETVDVYKMDHMSFDTLILRMTTYDTVFEIPYSIEFSAYQKTGDHYMIPSFRLVPLIGGFKEFISWLEQHLSDFNSNWLDETKSITDSGNLVTSYKRR